MATIGILGAGTWGIALARMLTITGHDVTVWSALPEEIEELASTRRHRNLPGMVVPEDTRFTADIEEPVPRQRHSLVRSTFDLCPVHCKTRRSIHIM